MSRSAPTLRVRASLALMALLLAGLVSGCAGAKTERKDDPRARELSAAARQSLVDAPQLQISGSFYDGDLPVDVEASFTGQDLRARFHDSEREVLVVRIRDSVWLRGSKAYFREEYPAASEVAVNSMATHWVAASLADVPESLARLVDRKRLLDLLLRPTQGAVTRGARADLGTIASIELEFAKGNLWISAADGRPVLLRTYGSDAQLRFRYRSLAVPKPPPPRLTIDLRQELVQS